MSFIVSAPGFESSKKGQVDVGCRHGFIDSLESVQALPEPGIRKGAGKLSVKMAPPSADWPIASFAS